MLAVRGQRRTSKTMRSPSETPSLHRTSTPPQTRRRVSTKKCSLRMSGSH
jgi:hypothetical protein